MYKGNYQVGCVGGGRGGRGLGCEGCWGSWEMFMEILCLSRSLIESCGWRESSLWRHKGLHW